MFLQRFVALFIIEILPRVINMDCKWPKLAFCSEISLFYSFERWSKYLRLGNRWKIDTLVQQFYGCFALQVFEPVTWLKTINWQIYSNRVLLCLTYSRGVTRSQKRAWLLNQRRSLRNWVVLSFTDGWRRWILTWQPYCTLMMHARLQGNYLSGSTKHWDKA